MSGVMETGMDGGKDSALERGEALPAGRRETRWSARRKEEVVLRLLRASRSTCWPVRSAGRPDLCRSSR